MVSTGYRYTLVLYIWVGEGHHDERVQYNVRHVVTINWVLIANCEFLELAIIRLIK